MRKNFWTEHASELADAYVRSAGTVRFEVVTRALLDHMPPGPQRVVDIGGGFGMQAILLARAGHSVAIVDCDPKMMAVAREKLSREPQEVSARVDLVLGDGLEADRLVGTGFDVVCCHSVLMYEYDFAPMLSSLVRLAREGGLISVLSLNRESSAMRSGLQCRWQEARQILEGTLTNSRYAPSLEQTRQEVTEVLEAAGARVKEWYGVGIFTDHLAERPAPADLELVYRVEWLAANRDPYRQVARCFHIVAERA